MNLAPVSEFLVVALNFVVRHFGGPFNKDCPWGLLLGTGVIALFAFTLSLEFSSFCVLYLVARAMMVASFEVDSVSRSSVDLYFVYRLIKLAMKLFTLVAAESFTQALRVSFTSAQNSSQPVARRLSNKRVKQICS